MLVHARDTHAPSFRRSPFGRYARRKTARIIVPILSVSPVLPAFPPSLPAIQ